jgi:hypothetical protein
MSKSKGLIVENAVLVENPTALRWVRTKNWANLDMITYQLLKMVTLTMSASVTNPMPIFVRSESQPRLLK